MSLADAGRIGRPSAIAAAWLFALYPTFIGFSQLLFLETLYICVLLAATLAVKLLLPKMSLM